MPDNDLQPDGDLDGDLIHRIKTGTAAEAGKAFEQLVVRHHPHLILDLKSRGFTAGEQEEIASEVWARAWRKIGRFEVRGVDLFPWLQKIAQLVTLERFRERYRGEPLDEGSDA